MKMYVDVDAEITKPIDSMNQRYNVRFKPSRELGAIYKNLQEL